MGFKPTVLRICSPLRWVTPPPFRKIALGPLAVVACQIRRLQTTARPCAPNYGEPGETRTHVKEIKSLPLNRLSYWFNIGERSGIRTHAGLRHRIKSPV